MGLTAADAHAYDVAWKYNELSGEKEEGIAAFLEKRQPNWELPMERVWPQRG
ncbi:MAG: hypothetical protein V3V35_10580 [Dehalococcoidia bacterium]